MLFFDIDRFKIINDSLGHGAGDQLLIKVAQRLERLLRPGCILAHFVGDEFTVLLQDILEVSDLIDRVTRIQEEMRRPFLIQSVAEVSHEVSITTSVGIVVAKAGTYERAPDVLRDADIAMYHAKQKEAGGYALFDAVMHQRAVQLLRTETELRRVIENGDMSRQLLLYFQPIIRLDGGYIDGFEALVRWRHPERGLISPLEFIPVAEETGLIVPLGTWVFEQACRQLRLWHQMFPAEPPLFMSINLAGRQFAQTDLPEQFAKIIQENDLDARTIRLEITESAIAEDSGDTLPLLSRLCALGLELSIDDFGTGHSSLGRLYQFPISNLKIDRSFVMCLGEPAAEQPSDTVYHSRLSIVSSIVALAHGMGHSVVAEGVETAAQLAILREFGCEYAQGFWMSTPLEAEAAESLLRQKPRW